MRTRLCELALKYRSDKCPQLKHGYTPFYNELLSKMKVRRLLEIGIGTPDIMNFVHSYRTGASLFMWQEFLPEAEIFGLDIRPDALINEGRIHSYLCDQSNLTSLRVARGILGGNFDFICDDGSHIADHQVLTANEFIPMLAPGGVYVIEDVLDVSIQSRINYPTELVNCMYPRIIDDRLVVYRAPC
jgi:hypothetical protein